MTHHFDSLLNFIEKNYLFFFLISVSLTFMVYKKQRLVLSELCMFGTVEFVDNAITVGDVSSEIGPPPSSTDN